MGLSNKHPISPWKRLVVESNTYVAIRFNPWFTPEKGLNFEQQYVPKNRCVAHCGLGAFYCF